MFSRYLRYALCLIFCSLLAACGSNKDDSSTQNGGSTSSAGNTSSSSSGGTSAAEGSLTPENPTGGWGTVVAGPDGPISSAYGTWYATIAVSQDALTPGQSVSVSADLSLSGGFISGLVSAGASVDKMVMMITAERAFDATGWARQAADQDSSTLLTPSGLAIEGGAVGAITNRFGYPFRSPIDVLVELPVPASALSGGAASFSFTAEPTIPADLPPGLYRIRADFGFKSKTAGVDSATGRWKGLSSLNMTTLGVRPPPPMVGSYIYSGLIPASGTNVAGQAVDATRIQARMPWTILHDYSTNGYAGVVADEDSHRFALAQKNLIHDEVVLPPGGSYRIEPTFPTEKADPRGNIRWNWSSGEVSGSITGPDGVTTQLPTLPFTGKSSSTHPGPTTGNAAYTAWTPTQQGKYTVVVKGWVNDASGRRYEGGGTYRFWVARRMTMATATFQGMSYPVGYKYGRDIAFFPAVPADVSITTTLYPNSGSGSTDKEVYTNSGQASQYGLFSTTQGMKQVAFTAPGEYHAKIIATYTDAKRDLWVCAMRHAGVIYPTTGQTIVARGKKMRIGGQYLERGETGREGYTDASGVSYLEHIAYPYRSGDLLLMANDETAAMNRIEPVLTYEKVGAAASNWDQRLDEIGTTNIYTRTSNGLSPHMFPEYITDRQYFYAAAARPGFMGRFIIADGDTQAPDWSTSRNSFGGQAGATQNGDIPGDLYRFFGGVVIRNQGQAPAYANYLSSGAILPKGSNNNRIIAAGAEDIIGSKGAKSRFFVAGFRPGTVLTEGTIWKPGMQVDPLLAVKLSLKLDQLKGSDWTTMGTAEAMGGADGSWLSPTAFTLKEPGAYRFSLNGEWTDTAGKKYLGGMPGLPTEGGEFYVASAIRPSGAVGLTVSLPTLSSFTFSDKLIVSGTSTASTVRYTLLMPGAILGQGEIPVTDGKYSIALDPGTINKTTPIYDFISLLTRQPMTYGGRILHLSLAAQEKHNGVDFWDVKRVIARGTTVIAVK